MRTVQVVSDLDLYRLYLPLEIRWLQLPSNDEICKEVDSPNTKLYGPYTSPCRNIENICTPPGRSLSGARYRAPFNVNKKR